MNSPYQDEDSVLKAFTAQGSIFDIDIQNILHFYYAKIRLKKTRFTIAFLWRITLCIDEKTNVLHKRRQLNAKSANNGITHHLLKNKIIAY